MSELGGTHEEQPTPNGAEIDVNPFTSKTSIKNPLGRSSVQEAARPPYQTPEAQRYEASDDTETSHEPNEFTAEAKNIIDQLVKLDVGDIALSEIRFPGVYDLRIIPEVLKQIENSTLTLGYGPFSEKMGGAWKAFINGAIEDFRNFKGIEATELLPMQIRLPSWLADHPEFDALPNMRFMDITIQGPVSGTLLTDAEKCRVTFEDVAFSDANIGKGAKKSDFIFETDMDAASSFGNTSDIFIHIKGNHNHGDIGPISRSKIICNGDWIAGYYKYRGTMDKHHIGPGIKPATC